MLSIFQNVMTMQNIYATTFVFVSIGVHTQISWGHDVDNHMVFMGKNTEKWGSR
jgi:predicted amino acid dehydrogenase